MCVILLCWDCSESWLMVCNAARVSSSIHMFKLSDWWVEQANPYRLRPYSAAAAVVFGPFWIAVSRPEM